jgi:LEA14-like dessication related protein
MLATRFNADVVTRIGAMLLLAALCGCATTAPEVTLLDVSAPQASDEAVQLDVAVQLVNRSTKPLDLHEFHYALSADGTTVFLGRWSAQATLAANSARTMTIPVVVPRASLSQAEGSEQSDLELKGRLDYTHPGKIPELLRELRLFRPAAKFAGPLRPPGGLTEPAP